MRYTITLTYDSEDEDSPAQAVEAMRVWLMGSAVYVSVVNEAGQNFGEHKLWGNA